MFGVERRSARVTVRIFMTGLFLFRSALALLIAGLLASCAEEPPRPTTSVAAVPTPPPGYWHGDGIQGSAKIVVSISKQRAYFFKGKQLVGESTVSTGKQGFSTPPGHYSVLSKDKDHVSSVFGDYVDDFGNVAKSNVDSRKDSRPAGSHFDGARMPYAMFFRGGYAMHQGYVPPYAASHGCIRVPQGMADVFFDNAPVGTPVAVKE
jgi:lipoprotein-anchoring transpeptidase ErfK/SrfK